MRTVFSFCNKGSALRHHSNTDTEAGLGEVPAPRPLSSWPRPTVNILLPSPLGSSRCSVNSFFFFKWRIPGLQEKVTLKNPLKTGTSYKMENRKTTKENTAEEGAGPSYIRSGDCFVLVLGYQNKAFLEWLETIFPLIQWLNKICLAWVKKKNNSLFYEWPRSGMLAAGQCWFLVSESKV